MRLPCLLLAALLLAGCAAGPAPGPGPAAPAGHGQDAPAQTVPLGLPVLDAAGSSVSTGSEPSILADSQGRYVWIGDTSGGSWSTDNGTTWHAMADLYLGALFSDGWTLAQDGDGALYAGVLADNRIDVGRSTDGGQTWETINRGAGLWATVDRPWIAAHGHGEVSLFYVAALGVLVGVDEHCARSTDGAATFTDQRPLAASPQGGKAFYDDEGRFYFVRTTGDLYRFDTTCLGGGDVIPMASGLGVNNMLQADSSGGDLYMAYANEAGRIVLAGSHGSGNPRTLTISPPALLANTYATVSAHGSQVAVAWYGSETGGDMSASGWGGDVRVYLAVVDGFWGNATVRTAVVTPDPVHHGTICMGGVGCTRGRELLDYFMLDHDVWGGLHVAYVSSVGDTGVRYVHVPPADVAALPVDAELQPLPRPASPTLPGPEGEPTATGTPSPSPQGHASEVPVAHFSGKAHGLVLSVDARSSTGRAPLSYHWAWGDGTASTGAYGSHTFRANGTYVVTLRVSDTDGRTSTASGTVHVAADAEPEPVQGESAPPGQVTITVPAPGWAAALAALGLAGAAARRPRRP